MGPKGLSYWLGLGSEDETKRDGLLSSWSEKHSAGIGISIGFIIALLGYKDAAGLFMIFAAIALGMRQVNVKQLKDVKNEPVYALFYAMVGFLITAFYIVPRLPNGVC